MEAKNILAADLLDLLFENRNKAYGAYELRKTYNKRLKKALLVVALVTIVSLGTFVIANTGKTTMKGQYKIDSLSLINLQPEEKKIEPPPTLPPPVKQPPIETTQFTPPKFVKEVPPEEMPPEVEDLKTTKIDVISQEGTADEGLAPHIESKQVIEEKKEEPEDKVFVSVQIEASFPGGDAAWKRFVERNLNPNVPIDNGAPAGEYQVWVQFIVDRAGVISDVKPLTNHGYGMEDEAVKIIRKGPQWNAAIQNGNKVKAYRKQSILFIVQASE